MKKQIHTKRTRRHKTKRVRAKRNIRRAARPRQVYQAIRKLLDTTNHIQARAAELENALDVLQEQERAKAIKELLVALRNSPDGDLLRFDPDARTCGGTGAAQAITAALVDAFSIAPIRKIGEQIALRDGKLPDNVELDRVIGDMSEECVGVEVLSAGWSYRNRVLLQPVVRPVLREGQNR